MQISTMWRDLMPKTHLPNICIILAQATFPLRRCQAGNSHKDPGFRTQGYANGPALKAGRRVTLHIRVHRSTAHARNLEIYANQQGNPRTSNKSIGEGRRYDWFWICISNLAGDSERQGERKGKARISPGHGLSLGWRIGNEEDLPIVAIIEWHG